MRKEGINWGGILPFVLVLAVLWGYGAYGAERVHAAGGTDTETLQGGAIPPTSPVPAEPDTSESPSTLQKTPKTAPPAKHQAAARKPAAGAHAVRNTMPEALGTPSAAVKQYTGKPISLDLLDADLRNVLRLLADLTGTNIVIEPDVTGKVTLKVEQVPWDQVLDMVLSMNDLGKEQVGNVIRVARQAKLRQEWAQQAEAIRARQDLAETAKDLGELSTVYLPVSFGKPAEVAAKIAEVKSDRGKVTVDSRTSLIIYSDYPARIANVRQLLSRLDKPTPQVLIEARIVTLTSEVSKTLSVDFGLNTSHQSYSTSPIQNFALNGPPGPTFAMNIAQLIGKTLLQVDLQLQALEATSQLRVMAAPRVMTLDNVKATISQGTQIPYLAIGNNNSGVTATEFKDAILELQVTPHITPDRKVRMTIEAKQDEPSATLYNIGDSQVPGIDTRKISTELLLETGNIVVIGGIIRNRDTTTKNQTPGLGDIPILGRLFKSETSDVTRNELLIFLSPQIVETTKPLDRS